MALYHARLPTELRMWRDIGERGGALSAAGISEMFRRGVDLRQIQTLLVDANLNTTAIYTAIYPDDLDEAIGKLSEEW